MSYSAASRPAADIPLHDRLEVLHQLRAAQRHHLPGNSRGWISYNLLVGRHEKPPMRALRPAVHAVPRPWDGFHGTVPSPFHDDRHHDPSFALIAAGG